MIVVDVDTVMTDIVRKWRLDGKTVGLVPTMGWFHEGHLALMELSTAKADKTVVSLFINPRQFGPEEDLDNYPRDLERDARMAEEMGVDVVFSPRPEIMYPQGYQTTVSVTKLCQGLCGESRPGHFDGVATVVTKLFNIVQPDLAVFGKKDYQQLALLRQLAMDLNYRIKILGHPIVREPDGMAMSSRNKYLDDEGRKNGLCLFQTLEYAKKQVRDTTIPLKSEKLIKELSTMINTTPYCEVDYISIVDRDTLVPTESAESGNILALAVFVKKKVRLIDNTEL